MQLIIIYILWIDYVLFYRLNVNIIEVTKVIVHKFKFELPQLLPFLVLKNYKLILILFYNIINWINKISNTAIYIQDFILMLLKKDNLS